MAVPRHRSRSNGQDGGTALSRIPGQPEYSVIRENGTVSCDDVVEGFSTDNYFNLQRFERKGGILDGFLQMSYPFRNPVWNHVPTKPTPLNFGTSLLPQESEAASALSAFNITNPGRPDILLPVFVYEMGDIPRMVRQLGDTLRWINNGIKRPPTTVASGLSIGKKLAADNLAFQFGWQPLVGDLVKMATFQNSVNKRRNEIERLHKGNGLKRRITLDSRSAEGFNTQTVYAWSTDGLLASWGPGLVKCSTSIKRWATVRYKPTSSSPLPTDDMRLRAMLTGLTPGALASNLWEAIPWTWLVDWFSNVGELVKSTNNSAGIRVTSCCVMTHSKMSYYVPPNVWRRGNGSVTFSGYTETSESKRRQGGLPSVTAVDIALPLLGNAQLSILGSLAVTRMGKR